METGGVTAAIPVEEARKLIGVGKTAFYNRRLYLGLKPGAPIQERELSLLWVMHIFLSAGDGPFFSKTNFMNWVLKRQLCQNLEKLGLNPKLENTGLMSFVKDLDTDGYYD